MLTPKEGYLSRILKELTRRAYPAMRLTRRKRSGKRILAVLGAGSTSLAGHQLSPPDVTLISPFGFNKPATWRRESYCDHIIYSHMLHSTQ